MTLNNGLQKTDKEFLINQLERTLQNFGLSMVGLTLLVSEDTYGLIRSRKAIIGNLEFGYDQFMPILENRSERDISISELLKQHLRTFLKESFEHIKTYVNLTGQFELMRTANWYQFARIMRNSLSHAVVIQIKPRDLSLLPVTWNNITVDSSMNNKELDLDFFKPENLLKLCLEMKEWAKQSLA